MNSKKEGIPVNWEQTHSSPKTKHQYFVIKVLVFCVQSTGVLDKMIIGVSEIDLME